MSSRLLLFALVGALAVVLGFWSFTPGQALTIVKHGGYWITLVTVVCFVVALIRSLRGEWAHVRAWRGWTGPVLIALAATAFLHVHERHEFKIVADEVVLQLTAKRLHEDRQVGVVVRGYEYAGNFTPMMSYVDKRPLFFPFLVATVHDLTGFRVGNVFALNAALSGVFVLLLLLIGRRLAGWGGGIAAVLLAITLPLLAQNAAGAGFELLNLTMIALALWLGLRVAERPGDDDRLGAFVLSGVLLAQVRYESVIFALPVAATVLYVWWRQKQIRLPWALLVAPLLLVICPLHFNVFKVYQAAWQMQDVAGADVPFSLRYFYNNLGHALNFSLSFSGAQPNSALLAVLGTISLVFLGLVLARRGRALASVEPDTAVAGIFVLGLLVHTGLMLCYFWGQWDDPIIRRLSLPAHLLWIVAIVLVWPRLVTHSRGWPVLYGLSMAYLVAFTLPASAQQRFNHENFAARTTNWLGRHIVALGDRSVLAIDTNAGLNWFLHGKSSVNPENIAKRPEALAFHFRNRSFQEYLLVQRATPDVKTGLRIISENDNFGDALTLELIEEKTFAPMYLVRLSRIVSLDEDKLNAWAERRVKHPPPPIANKPELSSEDSDQLLTWLRQLP